MSMRGQEVAPARAGASPAPSQAAVTRMAAVVAGVAASGAALKTLGLHECRTITRLPDLSSLVALEGLYLCGCSALSALPELSSLVALVRLNLYGCTALSALPDLSSLVALKELHLVDDNPGEE